MKTYNKFVDYYDEIIRGNWYDLDSEVSFLDETIQKFSPLLTREGQGVGEILEFACGTWTIAQQLEKKWYTVTWVDLSKQMIEKAKIGQTHRSAPTKKYVGVNLCVHPKNKFIVWDMTTINLNKQFDIVLCNYNSVCHLRDWKAWQDFFANAYRHLKKDGILVFDILTLFEFENISRDFKWFFNVNWDTICLEMFKEPTTLDFDKRGDAWKAEGICDWKGIYKWLIKMFINKWEKTFELVEEEIREISFTIEKIKKELKWIGFSIEHLEDFHFGEVTPESERVYFVVKK